MLLHFFCTGDGGIFAGNDRYIICPHDVRCSHFGITGGNNGYRITGKQTACHGLTFIVALEPGILVGEEAAFLVLQAIVVCRFLETVFYSHIIACFDANCAVFTGYRCISGFDVIACCHGYISSSSQGIGSFRLAIGTDIVIPVFGHVFPGFESICIHGEIVTGRKDHGAFISQSCQSGTGEVDISARLHEEDSLFPLYRDTGSSIQNVLVLSVEDGISHGDIPACRKGCPVFAGDEALLGYVSFCPEANVFAQNFP